MCTYLQVYTYVFTDLWGRKCKPLYSVCTNYICDGIKANCPWGSCYIMFFGAVILFGEKAWQMQSTDLRSSLRVLLLSLRWMWCKRMDVSHQGWMKAGCYWGRLVVVQVGRFAGNGREWRWWRMSWQESEVGEWDEMEDRLILKGGCWLVQGGSGHSECTG